MKNTKVAVSLLLFSLLQACGGGSSSEVQPAPNPNIANRDAYVLGSSTMEYMNNALTQAATENHYNLYNYAKGGEYLYSMCLRVGAFPGTIKFKNENLIANSKNYVTADWPFDPSLKTFDVEIDKIKGQIGVDQNGYYFTFNTIANTVIDPSLSYPIQSLFPKIDPKSLFIVNLGKNNLLGSDPILSSPQYVIEKSSECINWIDQNLSHNIIVVGFFTSTHPSEALINKVNLVNTALSKTYSHHFFDLKAYVEGQQIWQDTKITPNNEDLLSQKSQTLPLILSKDGIHVNEQANIAISKKILLFKN